jgi:hypothetical protein
MQACTGVEALPIWRLHSFIHSFIHALGVRRKYNTVSLNDTQIKNSLEHIRSLQGNRHSASQEIPCLL